MNGAGGVGKGDKNWGTARTLNLSPSQREVSGGSKKILKIFGNNFRSRVAKIIQRVPLYHVSSINREMT